MSARVRTIAAACAILLLAASAGAYRTNGVRWPGGSPVVMHLQMGQPSGPLIDGSTSWNTVAEGALARWNPFLNDVSFRVVRDSTSGTGLRNDVNNVIWGDDVYGEPFGQETLAIARWLYFPSTGMIAEADVVFNTKWSWNSYRGNLVAASGGDTLQDLRRVALHEFGHVIGLGHPDDHGQSVAAVMNSRIGHIDDLQHDDIGGARAIYGTPPAPQDTLHSGARLSPGGQLISANRRHRLVYQTDGNLVLYDDDEETAPWATGTDTGGAGHVVMQSDGNLVVYDAQGGVRWASGTFASAAYLLLQNDGNLVLYTSGGQPLWDRHR